MKVGMIFECGPDGADLQVCRYLARLLQSDIEIAHVTLDNKPKLVSECGAAAARLLAEGCERVVIVWDLHPPWRSNKQKPCRKEDRETISSALSRAGVDAQQVSLVCIEEELEAWLIADGRALTSERIRSEFRTSRMQSGRASQKRG
ncbi:MAG: hypothetical protein AB7G75_27675 [Candidatus Binatia bacterium]